MTTVPEESRASPDQPWRRLAGVDMTASQVPVRAKLDGETILIFRTPSGFRGVERACPHLQATLVDALLVGNGTMLRCAQHNFTFRLADGKGVNCPGHRLKVFEMKVEEGAVFARRVAP